MQPLNIPQPRKIATLTVDRFIYSTEENKRFFSENDLDEVTDALIQEGFDPSEIRDENIAVELCDIYEQRKAWETEGLCTKCGEFMYTDNSGDEYNPAYFTSCSNGCL